MASEEGKGITEGVGDGLGKKSGVHALSVVEEVNDKEGSSSGGSEAKCSDGSGAATTSARMYKCGCIRR